MIHRRISFVRHGLMLLAAALLLCGCNKTDDTATLSVAVADTPTDNATSVLVTFTGVELQGRSNVPVLYRFTAPKQVDLLQEQEGDSAVLLNGVDLNAGNYQSLRLLVDMSQSSITLSDGSVHPLVIPPGDDPSGFTLMSDFSASSGDLLKLTVDFDLRQAIILASGDYLFRPSLRLIDDANMGQISGIVASTLAIGGISITSASCSAAAYVYAGDHVTPVDIDPAQAVQPVTTASITLDSVSGNYAYTVPFMIPKTYTITLTCASGDNPGTPNALIFYPPRTVEVANDMTTEVDYP
ncbi:MAG TPA: DUF4382 domain-containing protein [Gammaproteobacteria bacterium]|nr:DUF4382 domain-containing protein [Gammaproteobacteria bacterium]